MFGVIPLLSMFHLGKLELRLYEELHSLNLHLPHEFHPLLLQIDEVLQLGSLDPLINFPELNNSPRELLKRVRVFRKPALLKALAAIDGHVDAVVVAVSRIGGFIGLGGGRIVSRRSQMVHMEVRRLGKSRTLTLTLTLSGL